MAFDRDLHWNLPEGEPPYTTAPGENQELMLYHEARRLYIFHHGNHPNQRIGNTVEEQKKLTMRREGNFVQLLEGLYPNDAKMLLAIKDKRLHKLYEGITPDLLAEAYPDVFQGMNCIDMVEPKKEEPAKPVKAKPLRKNGRFVKKEAVS